MSLRELQARFHDLVTAPEGVQKTLADQGASTRALEAMVVGDAKLSAVARLDIYANMYFFRLLDVLRDDYAKVVAAAGNPAFHNLVTDYLVACPPAHPSIAQAGARFPQFLAGHALAQEHPWLPALATLERTYSELFDGPDAEPLALEAMKILAPAEIMALVLRPIPCHRLIRHAHAIDELWHALDSGPPGTVAAAPETLLVWRQNLEVFHRAIDPDELQLLSLLDGRTSLQAICEHLPGDSVDEAAQRLFNVLGRWLHDSLLTRVAP
jgi:hypothetical protein